MRVEPGLNFPAQTLPPPFPLHRAPHVAPDLHRLVVPQGERLAVGGVGHSGDFAPFVRSCAAERKNKKKAGCVEALLNLPRARCVSPVPRAPFSETSLRGSVRRERRLKKAVRDEKFEKIKNNFVGFFINSPCVSCVSLVPCAPLAGTSCFAFLLTLF